MSVAIEVVFTASADKAVRRTVLRQSLIFWLLIVRALLVDPGCATESRSDPVATVDGVPIRLHHVQLEMLRAFGDRSFAEGERKQLEEAAVVQLVDRQLILRWLTRKQQVASDADIELWMDRLQRRLAVREATLQQYLDRRGMNSQDLRDALRWQLSWQRFLDRYLTDSNLAKYFDDHRREFDGTQLRISQIFVKPASAAAADWSAASARAEQIQQRLTNNELTFAEAAREYSDAPSGAMGGDIGLISRHEPMPEDFSKAAFELEPGQHSPPIRTRLGFHLIECTAVQPGQQRWQDVRPVLEQAVTRYLFQWAADQQRPASRVEWTRPPTTDRQPSANRDSLTDDP